MSTSYILNVKPTISKSDGTKMERDLNQRFQRVANKFSTGLKTGLKKAATGFGGALKSVLSSRSFWGVVAALVGTLGGVAFNNPFEKLTQSINELLLKMRTTAERAAQLGTTTGRYAEVEQIAKSAGVKNFDAIVSTFQEQLELSRQGQQPLLQEFTQNKDTLSAFIQTIESLKDLSEDERASFVKQIFGGNANLQLAGLFKTNLQERRQQIFGNISNETFGAAVDKLAKNSELQEILIRQTEVRDILAKSKLINEGVIRSQEQVYRARGVVENIQLGNYGEFAKWEIQSAKWQQETASFQTTLLEYVGGLRDMGMELVNFIHELRTKGWRAIF